MYLLSNGLPIITCIRRPHNRMCMKLLRLRVVQKHSRMVIKLQYHHRALNPKVERIVIAITPNPAEVRLLEMLFDLFQAKRS